MIVRYVTDMQEDPAGPEGQPPAELPEKSASPPAATDNDVEAKAADLRFSLLQRSRGMTKELREELFEQERLLGLGRGREEVAPAMFADSAEGSPVFMGLNHTRNLIGPVREAVEKIVQDPDAAAQEYQERLEARRGSPAEPAPETTEPDRPGNPPKQ